LPRSPLFDIYDPFGDLARQAQQGIFPGGDEELDPLGVAPLGTRKLQLADLMPEEEKSSLLHNLATAGGSGLAGLGWILDTPGAMVRGGLSGGPMKALSALWDTTDERVDGRELLRQYGMVGEDDTWGNFAGGLASEVFLDPLTYASLGLNQFLGKGAKTAAGAVAQKAGLLEDFGVYARNTLGKGEREAMREATARSLLESIPQGSARDAAMRDFLAAGGKDELLDQPLARMNRVSVPGFTTDATDFYGKSVGDWAAKTGDALGEGLMTNPYTGRVARGLQAAFDPNVLGFVDRDKQLDAQTIMAARRQRGRADRLDLAGLQYDANKELRAAGSTLNDSDLSDAMRLVFEGGDAPENFRDYLDLPAVKTLMDYVGGYRAEAVNQAERLGLPLKEFQSRTGGDWFPRQQLGFDKPQMPQWPEGTVPPERLKKQYSQGSRPVTFDDNLARGRDEAYDVMGQSDTLNRMSTDAELQQALRGAKNEDVRGILERWFQDNIAPRRSDPTNWHVDPASGEWSPADDFIEGVDGNIVPSRASGPSHDLYGWMDAMDDEGNYLYEAPQLPADHPLSRQARALREQMQRQTAAGETARYVSVDGKTVRPGNDELAQQLAEVLAQVPEAQREAWRDTMHTKLADFVRGMDPQHAETGLPIFGQNTFNELARYVVGRGRNEVNAQEMLKILKRQVENTPANAVTGGVNYAPADALKALGLTGDTAPEVLRKTLGVDSLDNVSFNKKYIDEWAKTLERGKTPPELSDLAQSYDNFTKRFKALALLWPSRYSRDAYSGSFSAATKGGYSPSDWWTGTQINRGEYSDLLRKIKDLPRYKDLPTDEAKLRQFLVEQGAEGLGTSTANDELLSGAGNASLRGMYPGATAPDTESLVDRGRRATWREWLNPFSISTASGNTNPILEAGDRAAQFTDSGNRYGSYLTFIRKGHAPNEAARLANLTQVDYRPEAFTDFERDVMKRAFPFYSYTKGITPLIADELVNNPAGLTGMSMRALNRGGQATEQNFTPEHMRKKASIPLPNEFPLLGLPADSPLRRSLSNIDFFYSAPVNLITPGTGNSLLDKLGSSAKSSLLNVLGQSNPLIKGPLEMLTNRQFYSGREMSDLYSMLEQPLSGFGLGPLGRVAEQVISNAPGGSRVLGLTRQLMDDRMPLAQRLPKVGFNTMTGFSLEDIDVERTKQQAARQMLNKMLESTPGVRTYENVTVPEDVLRTMPEEQRKMYLLYKIVQSEAAKRARDKKKAELALDPLQVLGVTNQF
jgi:hypothetical protein